jgi:hypothetical protein
VPRCGGWRAWGAVRADFERALADRADPAIASAEIASAEIASELRRGADYVRVTVALIVVSTDVADALARRVGRLPLSCQAPGDGRPPPVACLAAPMKCFVHR